MKKLRKIVQQKEDRKSLATNREKEQNGHNLQKKKPTINTCNSVFMTCEFFYQLQVGEIPNTNRRIDSSTHQESITWRYDNSKNLPFMRFTILLVVL